MAGFFCLQWHITNKCDQRCKHCYIFNSTKPIPSDEWNVQDAQKLLDDFLTFCKKYNKTPCVSLTGGDPLLHSRFWDIVELLKCRQISFNILGNPFHLNPKVIKRLTRKGC